MKKTLLFGMLVLAGITANAQPGNNLPLPNGSIAPDFTAVDIYGGNHSLYADYLNQGKSVIIDFSATWCGPCWSYHQTHAMADLYEAYGPEGSDEIMVMFIEGDVANTTRDNIFGVQGPIAPSQGNWTIGSPYPIIEDTAALNLNTQYDVEYFPTMYMICADNKQTTSVDQQTAIQLRNSINSGCQTLVGIANHGRVDSVGPIGICADGGTSSVQAKLKNFGNNQITTAVLVIKQNGIVVATQNYTGALNQFAPAATVTFDNVALTVGAEYEIEVTSINGAAPANADLTKAGFDIIVRDNESNNNIVVNVYTDNYPGEISWKIKDSNGVVVHAEGPYQAGPASEGGFGGPDASTTKTHYVTLPEGVDCYTLEMYDTYGDGWTYGSTAHGIEIFDASGSVAYFEANNFGALKSIGGAFRSSGALANETFATETFSIYPNPSNGVFNFATQESVSVRVTDLTGKTVFTAANINNGGAMDLSALQSGMYIATIKGASSERIEKLVIK